MGLTQKQIQFYHDNGYLAVEGVLSSEEIRRMVKRTEQLCSDWQGEHNQNVALMQESDVAEGKVAAKASSQTIRKMANLAPHEDVFCQHACNPRLVDMVADLIGTNISLYTDQMMLKPPRYGSEKPPHQDNAHFRVNPANAVITCWTALDDATIENGCMRYISGSHKLGLVDHTTIPDTPHLVPDGVDLAKSVAVPIKAGGCIFHHSLTLHHSYANLSDEWRRAFICHYVLSDAEMPKRSPESVLRIR